MTVLTEKLLEMRKNYLGVENEKNDFKDDPNSSIFCGEFKNIDKKSNPLKLMDVGFIIPNMCPYKDAIDLFYTHNGRSNVNRTDDESCIGLSRALCVYSSKSRKNLISKQKLSPGTFIYMRSLGESDFPVGAIEYQKLYIWRYGSFKISGVMESNYPHPVNGYELTIFNEKLQIEERAYYVRLGEI